MWTGTFKNVCLLLASRGVSATDRPVIGEDTVRHLYEISPQKGEVRNLPRRRYWLDRNSVAPKALQTILACLGATTFEALETDYL